MPGRRRSAGSRARVVHRTGRPRAGDTPVPLVCMLHGCTQDAASFAAATRMNEAADRHGFLVVYPQQEPRRQPAGLLELVPARAPGARRGRAGVDRRDRPRAHRDDVAVDDRPPPRLRGRPVRRRRHGRDPGHRLPRPVRRRRGALRARVPLGHHHGRRLHGDGAAAARTRSAWAAPRTPPWATTPVPSRPWSSTAAPTDGRPGQRATRSSSSSMAANRLAAPASGDLDIARPTTTVARPGPGRPRLHALALGGPPRRPDARTAQGRRARARMVRRRARRLLHRPARARRDRGDLALLRAGDRPRC